MHVKEKGKREDMAVVDKVHYEREMKTCIRRKGETKKQFKDPKAPKGPPMAFCFILSTAPKSKEITLACSLAILRRN
ncbi:High mobility group protein B1 [Sciurus carolinensis]|uniref:High mobility group protein B1 n=1 Tax=Sciurus carolinensis TaxID=30640 RepID=A0AA41MVW7_SCICA|nr:High mobility group protein B1 [Sciurus carolinensis]